MKTTTKVAALVLILIGGLAVLSPILLDKLGDAGGGRPNPGTTKKGSGSSLPGGVVNPWD